MFFKILFIVFFMLSSGFAYKVGDHVDEEILSTLNLKKDSIYVLDFFASWCKSCIYEIPLLSKANLELKKINIKLIGIDIDEDLEDGLNFQKKLKEKNQLNFIVINDNDNKIVEKFNPIGVPALYYIKNYKVVGIAYGAIEDIDKKILNDIKRIKSSK